ncbi:hypothetical protein CMV30_07010 [Nibricoccus aquaticus]|uniref:Uncharacterized protein n=1 Tax=Nibricoccus aquaticus TaxID=2576891 RepID=A0A290QIL6_9BACT|nr:hypothetical protein CMV30_07010 [Nibricoccus aquaticus]
MCSPSTTHEAINNTNATSAATPGHRWSSTSPVTNAAHRCTNAFPCKTSGVSHESCFSVMLFWMMKNTSVSKNTIANKTATHPAAARNP